MATTFQSDSDIPPHSEVPDETRHRLAEGMLAHDLALAKQLHRGAARNAKLEDRYRSEVESLFGKAKYRQFRDYVQKARADEAAKRRASEELPISQEQKERRGQKRSAAADAYVEKLGVSIDKLRALNERWAKRVVPPWKPDEKNLGRMVPERDVPREILKRKTNPWTVRTPPYEGWQWWRWWEVYNNMWWDDMRDDWWADPSTAMVGDYVGLANFGDATDWDWGWTKRIERVGFWYQMPAAGLVEMWVEAQVAFNQHHFDAWKEWGWSDWSFRQENAIAMAASGSSDGTGAWSVLEGRDIFNAHWDEHWRSTGDIRWSQYISDTSYARGDWVYVSAGNQNTMNAFGNDFETDCYMDFRWFIKSIHVHSTGDS
jgi:hypothetical protein